MKTLADGKKGLGWISEFITSSINELAIVTIDLAVLCTKWSN